MAAPLRSKILQQWHSIKLVPVDVALTRRSVGLPRCAFAPSRKPTMPFNFPPAVGALVALVGHIGEGLARLLLRLLPHIGLPQDTDGQWHQPLRLALGAHPCLWQLCARVACPLAPQVAQHLAVVPIVDFHGAEAFEVRWRSRS